MGMQDRKAQVIIPSLDAVAEFKVQTSNYSAEFGRNSGAVMIVNIKSGTNEFHGTAFEYLRNDYFDSRDINYADRDGDGKADPEILRQNQFGGTIGGPILRNRTHSSQAGKAGASGARNPIYRLGQRPTNAAGCSRTIRDPQTGQPFAGNRIPRDRFDPVSAQLLELWPEPNSAAAERARTISARRPGIPIGTKRMFGSITTD